jgi:hypothetical protein
MVAAQCPRSDPEAIHRWTAGQISNGTAIAIANGSCLKVILAAGNPALGAHVFEARESRVRLAR